MAIPPQSTETAPTTDNISTDNISAADNNAFNDQFNDFFRQFNLTSLLQKYRVKEILFPFGIIFILALLIIPLPTWLLDFGLVISISFSIMILITVIFANGPLDMNSFPSVLLLATLIRLGLNVSSTRLILSDGHQGSFAAGQMIETFGAFVVSGNYVIGVIIFSILVIINFIVITKGAGRIAEVAARFMLDALPGKQMAIDADLNAGLIDEATARKKRDDLSKESSFYGAMDGASKFVRGDAIAGILITFINIIAGMVIGILQRDMSFADAAQNYTLLTIGDGLVSQVPSLLVSIAAGILVTNTGSDEKVDKRIGEQFKRDPMTFFVGSGMLLIIGFVPGIPFIPFFILALFCAGFAFFSYRGKVKQVEMQEQELMMQEQEEKAAEQSRESPISESLQIDILRLELGYSLLSLMQQNEQKLTDQIKALRRQIASEYGFVTPAIRIQDNLQLAGNNYVIKAKEILQGEGELRPKLHLVMNPYSDEIDISGEATREPTFGLPAKWIQDHQIEDANFKGYTVVDCNTIITTHLTEIIKDNMAELLSYAETRKLLDELPDNQQKLIEDIIPNRVSVTDIQSVLRGLLAERVSIRDLPTIIEGICESVPANSAPNIPKIIEHVRKRLAIQICHGLSFGNNEFDVVTLTPKWDQIFINGVDQNGQLTNIPATDIHEFANSVNVCFNAMAEQGMTPAIMTRPQLRPILRQIMERLQPQTAVISQMEIHPKFRYRVVGQIE